MGQLGFYFNMKRCIGCRACQVDCADRNHLEPGIAFRRVRDFEVGQFPNPGAYFYSATCNHCQEAKCVKGCPTGAMHHDADGTVQHDKSKCVGCQYCVMNCPYGVPQFFPKDGIVSKCDSCKPLREAGQDPVCVASCVMRALEFGDLDVLRQKHGHELVNELPILPKAEVTKPSLLVEAKACALDDEYRNAGTF